MHPEAANIYQLLLSAGPGGASVVANQEKVVSTELWTPRWEHDEYTYLN